MLVLAVAWISTAVSARDVTVIPIEIQDGNNVTSVWIGGHELKGVVDTSGYHSIGISRAAITKVNVRFRDTFAERIDGGGQRFRGREFDISELRVGNGVFRDVIGFERLESASGEFGNAPFDVATGREFLQRYAVVVDYPRRRFELHPAHPARTVCGRGTGAIERSASGVMYSVLTSDGGALKLAWDTGATYSLLQRSVAATRGLRLQDDRYVTRRLTLGSRNLGPHRMVALELPGVPDIDGVIGSNFFATHRVCFDYVRRTVSVQ